MENPIIYQGGAAVDERGILYYNNNFDHTELGIKREYSINNWGGNRRFWHGHLKETKYIKVIKGAAMIIYFPISPFSPYVLNGEPKKVILREGDGKILKIPASCANGFKNLLPDTEIVFYSDKTLEESKNDDIRLPMDFISEEIWKIREY